MEDNIGTADRFIRLILGAALLIISFASHLASGLVGYATIGFGMIFFTTSVLGFCPIYRIFKFSTC